MSAIWGAISLHQATLSNDILRVLSGAYQDCAIDRTEELSEDHVVMGCGIQYFTKEAELEHLPCQCDKIWFNADVILDNRNEIMKRLNITEDGSHVIPDGELLRLMYQTYGDDCLNDLLGAYAFVNYNTGSRKIDVVIDAVGTRMLYYTIHNDVFYFSSLLAPLADLTNAGLNDRWLTDFIAMDHAIMINEAEETPYAGIYRVAPAHHVVIQGNDIHKIRYWNPQKTVKKLKFKNDEEYKKVFRDIFFEAVRCTMRYSKDCPLSAMLSGGYDSTSVVSVASGLLNKGEKIYSYTSVPLDSYVKEKENNYYIEDESALVKKTAEFLGNIEADFIDMPGVDAWNGREDELKDIEMPYKSPQNLLWMTECMKQARSRGSRIMLTGSYGNTSISFENMDWYFVRLITHFRLIKAEQELNRFQKTLHFNKKYARKQIIKNLLSALKKSCKRERKKENVCGKSYISASMLERTSAIPRLDRFNRSFEHAMFSRKAQKRLVTQDIELRQIGELEEKFSLRTGVLLRDPARDKRILEFCLAVPLSQFQKNGEIRRLISVYLQDIMPPHILSKPRKGIQSADLQYRLSLRWDELRKEWMENYQKNHDSRYIDTDAAYRDLQDKPNIDAYKQFDLARHFFTQLVMEFENSNK